MPPETARDRHRSADRITLGPAIAIPLTAIEPRITAAIFAGRSIVHESLAEAARRVTVPVQFPLPRDDEHVDRQSALALSGTFASKKDVARQPGRSPRCALVRVDDPFLARHLGRAGTSPA
jgi:hypothetical protein